MSKTTGIILGIGCLLVLLIVLACVGLFGGLAWLGFSAYRDMVSAAETFLQQIADGDIKGAYESAAANLRDRQSLDEFTATVRDLGLTDYQSASWPAFRIQNEQGFLEGTVTTRKGGSIPLRVGLVKIGKEWKVTEVARHEGGETRPDSDPRPMPSDAELRRLITDDLLRLNEAIRKKDFSDFYAQLAEQWKRQTSPEDMQKTFQTFIDRKIDFADIRNLQPVFDKKPVVNAEGLLEVEGFYPTKPRQVVFKMKYAYEHPKWKLIGVKVEIRD